MTSPIQQPTRGRAELVVHQSDRHLYWGAVLQFALRVVLVVFVAVALLLTPPSTDQWICVVVLAAYAIAVCCWGFWALRADRGAVAGSRTGVTLTMLGADVTAVATLSVMTGITSPEMWTSNVVSSGLFLIPLIAAAQLDPKISALTAVPTISAFFLTCWINKAVNEEPWASILLNTTVLAALAGGSVALSLIQRAKVETIKDLAGQRTQLLQELLDLEKHERQAVSERLHDGALQYVLVARQDVEYVRDGSADAVDRIDAALVECSGLLRDVVRELHPEVLARSGLKAALQTLASSIGARGGLDVEVDAHTWPDGLHTDVDHVLYGAAREALTNAVKHARAQRIRVQLEHGDRTAVLRIADDGVGISEEALSRSVEDGHIGMSSVRTKVRAADGDFAVRSTSPGTEVTVSIPLEPAAAEAQLAITAI